MPDSISPAASTKNKIPGLFNLYRKAFFSQFQRSGANLHKLPDVQISLENIQINPKNLRAYRKLCGFNANDPRIPATYLHNLAFRLQMALMTDKRWPLPVMGTVHLSNRIAQYDKLDNGPFNLTCQLDTYTITAKGCEFVLISQVFQHGKLIWQDTSRFMQFARKTAADKNRNTAQIKQLDAQQNWYFNAATGRKFARVSGDANPIHLGLLAARLFGFKKAIAHGMYSKARCLAALLPQLDGERYELEVRFKKPVYLPGNVSFEYQKMNTDFNFQLLNNKGEMCLDGFLKLIY